EGEVAAEVTCAGLLIGLHLPDALADAVALGLSVGGGGRQEQLGYPVAGIDLVNGQAVHESVTFDLAALHVEAFALVGLLQRRDPAVSVNRGALKWYGEGRIIRTDCLTRIPQGE